jgi:hypothetical protein
VLQNFGLILSLKSIDNILIQDLLFPSDGTATGPRDAIDLDAEELPKPSSGMPPTPTTTTQSTVEAHVRITHCSFDGYFDVSVDSRSYAGAPRLLATVHQRLFFDADPGSPTTEDDQGVLAFTNRGAINFGSLEDPNATGANPPQLVGNARVTIAYNVFVNVWRRCPRIANGNFGHIYNNFLYQWGFGFNRKLNGVDLKGTKGTNTWRGMEVGGGNGVVGGTTNGTALIEANRFIPWDKKDELADAIKIHPNTVVDIGLASGGHPNEFDQPNGRPSTAAFPTSPPALDRSPYGTLPTPETLTTKAQWKTVINQSGPRTPASNRADTVARTTAKDAIP